MLQEDEIVEAVHALCEEELDLLTHLLRRCGNAILKREALKRGVARLSLRSLSRVVLWEHRFDDQAALDMPCRLARALRKCHTRYGITDAALALGKEAKTHHVAGQSLVEDAQAMLPPAYVVYVTYDGPHVAVMLSPVTNCTVQ